MKNKVPKLEEIFLHTFTDAGNRAGALPYTLGISIQRQTNMKVT